MRKLLFGLIVFVSMTLTGCVDFIEEIFLNKDGTGQYSITMDASGLMANGGLRSMLQMAGEEAGEGMPEMDGPIEIDSVIYFKNASKELVQSLAHPELLDRISIHQQISEEKELMKTVFTLDFEKVGEIDYFLKDFSKLGGQNADMGPISEILGGMLMGKTENGLPLFTHNKKLLTRAKTVVEEMDEDDESAQMMSMMLSDASYKIIYHLPGMVKKTTLQNARVEKKDIIVEVPLLDVMKGKADLSGMIKFKGR